MSDVFPIARALRLKDCGLNEIWLQDQIWQNPNSLGIGELRGIGREVIMQEGGKLDLLLRDADDEAMYEVEVMLGATDESHIVRTLEYWDLARRKWPQRQHYAVIVAEVITRRFFNIIQIFGQNIPLIAIQANIIESTSLRCLHFTKILDIYQEPEIDPPEPPADREYWRKKAPEMLEAADALLPLLKPICNIDGLTYRQNTISMQKNNLRYFWFNKGRNGPRLVFRVNDDAKEEAATLLTNAGLLPEVKFGRVRVRMDKKDIEASAEALMKIAQLVLAYQE